MYSNIRTFIWLKYLLRYKIWMKWEIKAKIKLTLSSESVKISCLWRLIVIIGQKQSWGSFNKIFLCDIPFSILIENSFINYKNTWQKMTTHIQWEWNVYSFPCKYRSCILRLKVVQLMIRYHKCSWLVYNCFTYKLLGKLLDFLSWEHASILYGGLLWVKSIVHFLCIDQVFL